MTLSANEIGWRDLLKLLYKFKNNGMEISDKDLDLMRYINVSTLINEDAVTCAIYFYKLVSVMLNILKSKQFSPFGKFAVLDYFLRIEFQHRGSPHAHILLYLYNAPQDPLNTDYDKAFELIDALFSISTNEVSNNNKLQTHKYTFICYKKIISNKNQQCRFEAPFMPSHETLILIPMQKTDVGFANFVKWYKEIRINLENNDYPDIYDFYEKNDISSDDDYF